MHTFYVRSYREIDACLNVSKAWETMNWPGGAAIQALPSFYAVYFWSGPCECRAIRSPFETEVPDFQFTEVGMGFIKESALLNSVVEFSQNGRGIQWIHLNQWSMNSSQFKDLVSRMYLADAVVASWFLTEEVAGIFTEITNIFLLNFLNSVKIFRENSNGEFSIACDCLRCTYIVI